MKIELPSDFSLEICPHARPTDPFLSRLIEFYHRQPEPKLSQLWQDVAGSFQAPIIAALREKNVTALGDNLCSMYGGMAVWGLDDWNSRTDGPDPWEAMIVRLCMAIGMENRTWKLEEALSAISWHLGFELFRPGGGGMRGLLKAETCLPRKHLEALTVLVSIMRLPVWPPARVLEIGGGLGFLAAAIRLASPGCRYDTLDLPVVSVMQAYLLSFIEGEERVCLGGEQREADVRIHGPALTQEADFDLIINQDSLPEMPHETVDAYIDLISRRLRPGGMFLSINQEGDGAICYRSVHTAMKWTNGLVLVSRDPAWCRLGYVQEVWRRA